MKFRNFILTLILFQTIHFSTTAATAKCCCNGCIRVPETVIPPPGNPGNITPFGCYGGIDCPNGRGSMPIDAALLNLKEDLTISNGRVAATNSAIQITQTDFENFVQVGKSILFSVGYYDYFSMNIGVPNAMNAQSWTLPSNLAQYVDANTTRLDIISLSAVPPAMQVAGATHVLKEIASEGNLGEADVYYHLHIDGTEVTNLGTSYDFEVGNDDNFGSDEPDVELYDVPLNLGDNQVTEEFPIDEKTNVNYLKTVTSTIVDAFGTINTPYGSFECLRQTEITKHFRRPNATASYGSTPNYEVRRLKWITKNGFVFSAAVQTENNAHVGVLAFPELTRFVPTNTLTSQSAVKINNDSKGVAINNTDFVAHESAILDINSDSLGVLIPRITKANRPASPAEGLLIYQVDNTPGLYYYNGTAWRILSSSASARIAAEEPVKESISGKNQLENGSTFIKFDQPRDDFEKLIINLQLEGDCNGIYISKKTREGFEVRELQKGKSNVKFSWKID